MNGSTGPRGAATVPASSRDARRDTGRHRPHFVTSQEHPGHDLPLIGLALVPPSHLQVDGSARLNTLLDRLSSGTSLPSPASTKTKTGRSSHSGYAERGRPPSRESRLRGCIGCFADAQHGNRSMSTRFLCHAIVNYVPVLFIIALIEYCHETVMRKSGTREQRIFIISSAYSSRKIWYIDLCHSTIPRRPKRYTWRRRTMTYYGACRLILLIRNAHEELWRQRSSSES